jgi:hypothetical protein
MSAVISSCGSCLDGYQVAAAPLEQLASDGERAEMIHGETSRDMSGRGVQLREEAGG